MEGIQFVVGDHMRIADGIFLPRAELLGYLSNSLHGVVHQHPELKLYLPNLLAVDVFVAWDGDTFVLFISTEARAHIPTRGMQDKILHLQAEADGDVSRALSGFSDISDRPFVLHAFKQFGFTPGFAAVGTFPAKAYDSNSKVLKEGAGQALAELMQAWAGRRQLQMERSRIFLSHKGVNKPFIAKVDSALRMIGLRTWFDQDDLPAGDVLVRGVDNAFEGCSAAVFFISGDFADASFIAREIDRALHECTVRPDSFRIIPLVLAQHGGTDERMPKPLQTLVWKTVDDVDVVPTILRSLPSDVQNMVRYCAPKQ